MCPDRSNTMSPSTPPTLPALRCTAYTACVYRDECQRAQRCTGHDIDTNPLTDQSRWTTINRMSNDDFRTLLANSIEDEICTGAHQSAHQPK
jgi:hypothetical protein